MSKVVDLEELMPIIEEQLNNGGKVKFTPKGNSMLPLFRHNMDTVTIIKPTLPLKKYDISLYKRDNEQYVLHRVVKAESGSYVMRGDNQLVNESGIKNDQIIGVVTSFQRKGKEYSVNGFQHRLYSMVWVNTLWLKKLYKKTRKIAGKIKRKILGKYV